MELRSKFLKDEQIIITPLTLLAGVGIWLMMGGLWKEPNIPSLIVMLILGVLAPISWVVTVFRLIKYRGAEILINHQGIRLCRGKKVLKEVGWDEELKISYQGVGHFVYDSRNECPATKRWVEHYSIEIKDPSGTKLLHFRTKQFNEVQSLIYILVSFSPSVVFKIKEAGLGGYQSGYLNDYLNQLSQRPPQPNEETIHYLNQKMNSKLSVLLGILVSLMIALPILILVF